MRIIIVSKRWKIQLTFSIRLAPRVTFLLLIRNVVHANISTTMNIQFGTLTFANCSVGALEKG